MTRRPRFPHTNDILMAQAGIDAVERRQPRVAAVRRDFPEFHRTLVRGAKAQFPVNSLFRGGCYATH